MSSKNVLAGVLLATVGLVAFTATHLKTHHLSHRAEVIDFASVMAVSSEPMASTGVIQQAAIEANGDVPIPYTYPIAKATDPVRLTLRYFLKRERVLAAHTSSPRASTPPRSLIRTGPNPRRSAKPSSSSRIPAALRCAALHPRGSRLRPRANRSTSPRRDACRSLATRRPPRSAPAWRAHRWDPTTSCTARWTAPSTPHRRKRSASATRTRPLQCSPAFRRRP